MSIAAEDHAPLLLRPEPWGGLALDRRHDRVWAFGRNEFAAVRDVYAKGSPVQQVGSALVRDFLTVYGPGTEGLANPYSWPAEYFIGTRPSPDGCQLSAPISVSWSITNRCQSTCTYCCTESHPRAHYGGETESLLRSVDLLARWGVLRLIVGGGEPLLRDDILTVLRHATDRGLRPTIASNGLTIAEMGPGLLRGLVMQVQISLDSLREPTYRTLRGTRDGVRRVVEGIRALRRAEIPVRVVTVLTQQNEADLEPLAAFLADEGVAQWFVFVVQPSGRASRRFDRLRPEDLATGIETLASLDDNHPELSISLWGSQPEDQLAVALDSHGELTIHDYGTGTHQRLASMSRASLNDLETVWAQVPPRAKWSTLVNFTRANRRVSTLVRAAP